MGNKINIAINGFGRIGRNTFKILSSRSDCNIVAINDISDPETLVYLLKHDSIYHGFNWADSIELKNGDLIIGGSKKTKFLNNQEPSSLPWKNLNIDVVIECTGKITSTDLASKHLDAGAKRVLISTVPKDTDSKMIILGVNDHELDSKHKIFGSGSCTTNCLAPIVDLLDKEFGIQKAMMTTIHSYTNSQKLHDSPSLENLRESRMATENIIPSTTGVSKSIGLLKSNLLEKFSGLSIRVPTPTVSLVDLTVLLNKNTTISELNKFFKEKSRSSRLSGILDITNEELVSTDFIGNSSSTIIDANLTNVIDGNFIKIVAWYDNEWGFCNRLSELALEIGHLQ